MCVGMTPPQLVDVLRPNAISVFVNVRQCNSLRETSIMTIYVAEIKGQGIVAFRADSQSDAEIRAKDRTFRDDLMVLATQGRPLWDGVMGIHIRQARPVEEAKWRASRAKAIRLGDIEPDDEAWIVFLVALTDPDRRKR